MTLSLNPVFSALSAEQQQQLQPIITKIQTALALKLIKFHFSAIFGEMGTLSDIPVESILPLMEHCFKHIDHHEGIKYKYKKIAMDLVISIYKLLEQYFLCAPTNLRKNEKALAETIQDRLLEIDYATVPAYVSPFLIDAKKANLSAEELAFLNQIFFISRLEREPFYRRLVHSLISLTELQIQNLFIFAVNLLHTKSQTKSDDDVFQRLAENVSTVLVLQSHITSENPQLAVTEINFPSKDILKTMLHGRTIKTQELWDLFRDTKKAERERERQRKEIAQNGFKGRDTFYHLYFLLGIQAPFPVIKVLPEKKTYNWSDLLDCHLRVLMEIRNQHFFTAIELGIILDRKQLISAIKETFNLFELISKFVPTDDKYPSVTQSRKERYLRFRKVFLDSIIKTLATCRNNTSWQLAREIFSLRVISGNDFLRDANNRYKNTFLHNIMFSGNIELLAIIFEHGGFALTDEALSIAPALNKNGKTALELLPSFESLAASTTLDETQYNTVKNSFSVFVHNCDAVRKFKESLDGQFHLELFTSSIKYLKEKIPTIQLNEAQDKIIIYKFFLNFATYTENQTVSLPRIFLHFYLEKAISLLNLEKEAVAELTHNFDTFIATLCNTKLPTVNNSEEYTSVVETTLSSSAQKNRMSDIWSSLEIAINQISITNLPILDGSILLDFIEQIEESSELLAKCCIEYGLSSNLLKALKQAINSGSLPKRILLCDLANKLKDLAESIPVESWAEIDYSQLIVRMLTQSVYLLRLPVVFDRCTKVIFYYLQQSSFAAIQTCLKNIYDIIIKYKDKPIKNGIPLDKLLEMTHNFYRDILITIWWSLRKNYIAKNDDLTLLKETLIFYFQQIGECRNLSKGEIKAALELGFQIATEAPKNAEKVLRVLAKEKNRQGEATHLGIFTAAEQRILASINIRFKHATREETTATAIVKNGLLTPAEVGSKRTPTIVDQFVFGVLERDIAKNTAYVTGAGYEGEPVFEIRVTTTDLEKAGYRVLSSAHISGLAVNRFNDHISFTTTQGIHCYYSYHQNGKIIRVFKFTDFHNNINLEILEESLKETYTQTTKGIHWRFIYFLRLLQVPLADLTEAQINQLFDAIMNVYDCEAKILGAVSPEKVTFTIGIDQFYLKHKKTPNPQLLLQAINAADVTEVAKLLDAGTDVHCSNDCSKFNPEAPLRALFEKITIAILGNKNFDTLIDIFELLVTRGSQSMVSEFIRYPANLDQFQFGGGNSYYRKNISADQLICIFVICDSERLRWLIATSLADPSIIYYVSKQFAPKIFTWLNEKRPDLKEKVALPEKCKTPDEFVKLASTSFFVYEHLGFNNPSLISAIMHDETLTWLPSCKIIYLGLFLLALSSQKTYDNIECNNIAWKLTKRAPSFIISGNFHPISVNVFLLLRYCLHIFMGICEINPDVDKPFTSKQRRYLSLGGQLYPFFARALAIKYPETYKNFILLYFKIPELRFASLSLSDSIEESQKICRVDFGIDAKDFILTYPVIFKKILALVHNKDSLKRIILKLAINIKGSLKNKISLGILSIDFQKLIIDIFQEVKNNIVNSTKNTKDFWKMALLLRLFQTDTHEALNVICEELLAHLNKNTSASWLTALLNHSIASRVSNSAPVKNLTKRKREEEEEDDGRNDHSKVSKSSNDTDISSAHLRTTSAAMALVSLGLFAPATPAALASAMPAESFEFRVANFIPMTLLTLILTKKLETEIQNEQCDIVEMTLAELNDLTDSVTTKRSKLLEKLAAMRQHSKLHVVLNIANSHFTLLSFTKIDESLHSVYVDSIGDYHDSSKAVQRFCSDNALTAPNMLLENYQHNNDCAVHVIFNAIALQESFSKETLSATIQSSNMHDAQRATGMRYEYAQIAASVDTTNFYSEITIAKELHTATVVGSAKMEF